MKKNLLGTTCAGILFLGTAYALIPTVQASEASDQDSAANLDSQDASDCTLFSQNTILDSDAQWVDTDFTQTAQETLDPTNTNTDTDTDILQQSQAASQVVIEPDPSTSEENSATNWNVE